MSNRTADTRFDIRWHILAERGQCDGYGGAEYRRIFSEWVYADRPAAISLFILSRARYVPPCPLQIVDDTDEDTKRARGNDHAQQA